MIFRPAYDSRASLRSFPLTFYPGEVDKVDWSIVNFKNGHGCLELDNRIFTDPEVMRDLFCSPPPLKDFLKQVRQP